MRFWLTIFLFPAFVFSQNINRSLLKANSLWFRNNIYVFGFVQDKNDLIFKLYKAPVDLTRLDSISNLVGKEKVENLLDITSDTLHGYLNFYLQKINSKNLASLVRFNDSLKLITKVENFESNKINSLTTFENEIYTYKNSTYTIRTSEDSLGKQFYLTKYVLISPLKPFEYKQAWQYPLEKRNINTTHIIYADSETVLTYVTIYSGEKSGQWLLKVNAKNGTIVKGIKLNAKGDERNYLFSGFDYDSKSKELFIAGNIYTKQQVNFDSKNFGFTNLTKQNTFFFIRIDESGEVISRDEKTVPITFIASAVKSGQKAPPISFYHLKVKELKKVSKNDFEIYCTIYKSSGSSLLFLYESGFNMNVSFDDISLEVFTGKIYNNLSPFPNLVNTDLKDINGKIELKSIVEFDKFLYKWPIVDVEKHYGISENKNPKWIIGKSDIKTAKNYFYNVGVGLKGIESKLLMENSKYNNPSVYKTKNDKLVLFNYNSETSLFNLSTANW